jgi:hypothetical protein
MIQKITLVTLSIWLFSMTTVAQKTVNAAAILKDIKAGKSIAINNAIVEGDLDLTFMEEAFEKMPRKKKSSWFNWNS